MIDIPRIDRYTILADYSTNGLSAQVATFIGNGWQPYGEVKVTPMEGQVEYLQAMIKHERVA